MLGAHALGPPSKRMGVPRTPEAASEVSTTNVSRLLSTYCVYMVSNKDRCDDVAPGRCPGLHHSLASSPAGEALLRMSLFL